MTRDKDNYNYYLVGVEKKSYADKGLRRDLKKSKHRYIATLIGELIADRYDKLDGPGDEPSLWFPDPNLLQVAKNQAVSNPIIEEELPDENQHTGEVDLTKWKSNLHLMIEDEDK